MSRKPSLVCDTIDLRDLGIHYLLSPFSPELGLGMLLLQPSILNKKKDKKRVGVVFRIIWISRVFCVLDGDSQIPKLYK